MRVVKRFAFSLAFAFSFAGSAWVCAAAAAPTSSVKPGPTVPVSPSVPLRPTASSFSVPENSVSVAFLQGKAPVAPDAIGTLGPDLFGDKINLYNGAFSFEQTDAELPGNNALPVAFVRTHSPGRQFIVRGALGDWDINTPRIEGSFADPEGWVPLSGSAANRCSGYNMPPYVARGGFSPEDFSPDEYWQGTNLVLPGHGAQELLVNTHAPNGGGQWNLVTRNLWQVGCLPSVQNAPGQGFVARSPEGVTYRFDWMATRLLPSLRKGEAALSRKDHMLMATRVTDRFGNWVAYTYNPANPLLLTRIESSDGRVITVSYASGRVSAVSDGTRTFQYTYDANCDLQNVIQPDGSRWSFSLRSLVQPEGTLVNEGTMDCDSTAQSNGYERTGTLTHPSGATGTFTSNFIVQGRTYVERICTYYGGSLGMYSNGNVHPRSVAVQALTRKQISGPGMATLEWRYRQGSNNAETLHGTWGVCTPNPSNPSACPINSKVVEVLEPNGSVSRHTFGIHWRVNEGQLLRTEEGGPAGAPLKTTDIRYRTAAGQAYPDGWGSSPRFTTDLVSTRNRPEDLRRITQQSVQFRREVQADSAGFDFRVRPLRTTLASSNSAQAKLVVNEYRDFDDLWVLGQPRRTTVGSPFAAGLEAERLEFDAQALPVQHHSFGRLTKQMQYRSDGTLWRLLDGAGNTTTFNNFRRGQPQEVVFADGRSASQLVNNLGHADSFTNPVGTTTSLAYDAMGRVAQISYPPEPGLSYFPTTQSFVQVPSTEFGIGPGHWRQTIATGNAVKVRYFDALWRERATLVYDAANVTGTSRMTETRWDAQSRKVFQSCPTRGIAAVDQAPAGTAWARDGLGRVIGTYADSELSPSSVLSTLVSYEANFVKRVTSPRGYQSVHTFQTFEEPSEDTLASVVNALNLPESTRLVINRDVFGKALSITRSSAAAGNVLSLTRSYTYDQFQRLCKTIEPESGATVVAYDAANNLAWRASGQSLPSTSACDQASVPAAARINYSYDARNRLLNTTYGDGGSAITRSYTPDGLLLQAASAGTTWTYTYNNRRIMSGETIANTGGSLGSFSFARTINASGHLAAQGYPDGSSLSYAPNALGEPTQVSGFASGVGYHPNGQVSGYQLANGIAHSNTQNLRGLPLLRSDSGVQRDHYSYDASGNVTAIADLQDGLSSRSMAYDALDRLGAASGIWGSASYSYDALDNLRSSTVGARTTTTVLDSRNLVSQLIVSGVAHNLSHDANGNLRTKGAQTYTFDIANRMTAAPGHATYAYDAHGRRTWVGYSNGSWKLQIYGQAGKLLWSGHSSQGNTRHIYLGDQLIAEANTQSGISYSHTDALGSPVARTNASGQITSRTRYEPYGATAAGTNPTGVGFTGHVNDADTGLVYMQQRYYDPIAGRFLSVDPVTTNAKDGSFFGRYHYANNNPYKFKDPDGRAADLALDLVFIAADLVDIGKNGLNLSNGVSLAGNLVGAAIPFATGLGKLASTAVTAGKVADTTSATRSGALAAAKEANGIPRSAQPDAVIKPGTPAGNAAGLDSRNVRQYEFTNSKGEKISIREDKAATYPDGGTQSRHFNAGPSGGKLEQHHYIDDKKK
jgi:RHS repeat-associated protein